MEDTAKPLVLVVDDEKDVNKEISGVLLESGQFDVVSAFSGEEAVDTVKKFFNEEKHIDVVLLDIKMPGLWGTDAVKKIKEIDKELEVIMLTALNDSKYAWEAHKSGSTGYIVKPFKREELLPLVKKAGDERIKRTNEIKKVRLLSQLHALPMASPEIWRNIMDELNTKTAELNLGSYSELPYETLKKITEKHFK